MASKTPLRRRGTRPRPLDGASNREEIEQAIRENEAGDDGPME
jgi:hypothetical protein